jgi:LPXTG-site transpeptidase (sortase) family protein
MNNRPYISPEELHRLFHAKPKKRLLPSWQLITASILIVLAVFLFINGPAIQQQLSFWWESDIQAGQQQAAKPVIPPVPAAQNSANPTQPTAGVTQTTPQSTIDPTTLADNTLYIPKIRAKAPVIWDVTAGADINTDLTNALRYGVVRYPQTALPNQIGNVFLTGHSSNYWWDKGHYKTIFALLDKLVAGDVVYIKFGGRLYTYKVAAQKIIKPTETSVLSPTKTPVLSLMTCTPTGTSLLRRVVTANLISPTDGLTMQTSTPTGTDLQAVR